MYRRARAGTAIDRTREWREREVRRGSLMTPTRLLKYTAALVTLAIWTACAGGSAVAPSNIASNLRYIGRTAFVNGRPVTAARPNLSAVPRYAAIPPDRRRGDKKFEYVINSTARLPASSTIRKALIRSVRSMTLAAKAARTSSSAMARKPSGSSRRITRSRSTGFPTSPSRRSLFLTVVCRRAAP